MPAIRETISLEISLYEVRRLSPKIYADATGISHQSFSMRLYHRQLTILKLASTVLPASFRAAARLIRSREVIYRLRRQPARLPPSYRPRYGTRSLLSLRLYFTIIFTTATSRVF